MKKIIIIVLVALSALFGFNAGKVYTIENAAIYTDGNDIVINLDGNEYIHTAE